MKKMTMWLMAVILVLCSGACALPAAAAETVRVAMPTFMGGVRGGTVIVPVAVSEVSDLTAIELHLQYDEACLEFVSGEACGFITGMNMASAVKAASASDEVWLSAMALSGVSGSGEIFELTFRVREDAPVGETKIGFATYDHMLLAGASMTELPLELNYGAIDIGDKTAVATTTASEEQPAATDVITRADGQTVTVAPAATVVDLRGALVTDVNGDPLRLQGAAVMVDQLTAEPETEVTVQVSLTAVAELTSLEIGLTFDTKALTFVGGEGLGFVGNRLRMRETDGGLLLQAESAAPMSGSGAIASLTFRVNDTARAGSYRLGLDPAPRLLVGTALLGVQPYAGEIRVLSDGVNAAAPEGMPWWLWIAIGVCVLAVLWLVTRFIAMRSVASSKPVTPRSVDISGDEE